MRAAEWDARAGRGRYYLNVVVPGADRFDKATLGSIIQRQHGFGREVVRDVLEDVIRWLSAVFIVAGLPTLSGIILAIAAPAVRQSIVAMTALGAFGGVSVCAGAFWALLGYVRAQNRSTR